MKLSDSHRAVVCAGGLAAGFINGLLGTGAGIVLVFVLSYLTGRRARKSALLPAGTSPDADKDNAAAVRRCFATSLSGVFGISLLSALFYGKNGAVAFGDFAPLALPSMLGGAVGAYLLSVIKPGALKTLFAVLLIVSGILMLR